MIDDWSEEKYQDYDDNYPDWLQDKPATETNTALDIFNDSRFQIVERGVIFDEPLTFEEYRLIWSALENFDAALPFVIGDLMCYGELTYGEMYTQVLGSETGEYNEMCHFKPGTLRDYKYVAKRFPVSSRLYALPWSYYQTVAGLEHSQAMALLQHCEEHGLKRPELRQQAREFNNGKSNLLPATRDDINHELTVTNHQKDQRIAELESELATMQQAIIMPDEYTEALTDLDEESVAQVVRVANLVKAQGFSAVTIYANGDVQWKR